MFPTGGTEYNEEIGIGIDRGTPDHIVFGCDVLGSDVDAPGTNEFIFQQVESLDNLIVESGREKPPKFINERYLLGSQMGQGSYGKVKQVLDTFTLQKMAVKIMNKQKLKKIPNGEKNALNEFRVMRKLDHENIVAVYDLLENAPDKKLPTWQAHKYFCDLMKGIEYLHSQRVIHKDVKPQNLLLSPNETLKITDFGVAEELDLYASDGCIRSSAGTPMFQPPEVAAGKSSFCGFKLDVWSAGVTLYNFTTGGYPFEGHNLYLLLDNIAKQSVHVPVDLSPQLQSLLKLMLERNPRDRYSVAEVKTHRWFIQKHCVTPERVFMPNVAPPMSIPQSYGSGNRSNSVDFMSSRGHDNSALTNAYNKNTLPLSANKSSTSFNYYANNTATPGNQLPRGQHHSGYAEHEFVNSLEEVFNLADSEVGNSKMEADDLMQVAGGGGMSNYSSHNTNNSSMCNNITPTTSTTVALPQEQQANYNGSTSTTKSQQQKQRNGSKAAGTDPGCLKFQHHKRMLK